MKKLLVLIILLILIVSCSNHKEQRKLDEIVSNKNEMEVPEAFLFEKRTEQQLQDYFDLLVLEQKHPEFRIDILKQLKSISSVKKNISDTKNVKIQNLSQIESVQKVSDSVRKFKVSFDIVSGKLKNRDTIIVLLKTRKIIIEGEDVDAIKIKFVE